MATLRGEFKYVHGGTVPLSTLNQVIGSVNLSTISDGDAAFVIKCVMISYRVRGTTPYPEVYERMGIVSRRSNIYTLTNVTADVLNDADSDNYVQGFTEFAHTVFSFNLSSSNIELRCSNVSALESCRTVMYTTVYVDDL